MHDHALVLGGQACYTVGPSPIDSARNSSEEKNNLSRNDLSLQAASAMVLQKPPDEGNPAAISYPLPLSFSHFYFFP